MACFAPCRVDRVERATMMMTPRDGDVSFVLHKHASSWSR